MAITKSGWDAVRRSADQYARVAPEIKRIEADISLFRQGRKQLVDISPNRARVTARLQRETAMLRGAPMPAQLALERSLGRPDYQDACVLQRIVGYSHSVGRIMLAGGEYATGWLVGEGLLITNHHVFPNREAAQGAFVTMGYERTEDSQPQAGENFALQPDEFFLTPQETQPDAAYAGLDFTVVAVAPTSLLGKPLTTYRHVTLDGGLGKVIEGENCLVIQHPGGDFKKVVLRDIRLLKITDQPGADQYLFYESDTEPGSSGSMVVALGTGEIVALHNASVPRRDANGNYLKKDGSVYQPGESDELIDWIANQGVRVSKVMEALQTLPPQSGTAERQHALLEGLNRKKTPFSPGLPPTEMRLPEPVQPATTMLPEVQPAAAALPTPALAAVVDGDQLATTSPPPVAAGQSGRYVLRLGAGSATAAYTQQALLQQFPQGQLQPLLPEADQSALASYFVLTLPAAAADPWTVAAQLETIDGVLEAEPDLPQRTTSGLAGQDPAAAPRLTESGFLGLWSDGRSEWNEPDFLRRWAGSGYLAGLDPHVPAQLLQIREWNRRATGFDQLGAQHLDAAAVAALSDLRLAQFDTGYSDHSKLAGGYDLTADYDLVDDDDDARDEMTGGFLKFPGHGTRTGSLLVGVPDATAINNGHDGNEGFLRAGPQAAAQVRLTPFRIAKSVILIDRVSELVRGVHRAVDSGYPVLTMSMGTLGSSALDAVARYAYERGAIWCCAAGNQVRFVVAPGKYPGVICVAASNPDDGPWSGSCRGPEVDVTAPGEDIYVPILTEDDDEDMAYGSGTSYATPHVAAAALLWLARHQKTLAYPEPWQRVEAFRYCLRTTVRLAAELPTNRFGAGILQVDKLLLAPLPDVAQLRHAYTNAQLSPQERGAGERPPLAMRELAYKTWQQVLGTVPVAVAGPATPNARELLSATAASGFSLSPMAQAAARILAQQAAGPLGRPHLQESLAAPTAGPYEQLRAVHQLQAVPKPAYAPPAAPIAQPPAPARTTPPRPRAAAKKRK